ncbi:uncharacterized protein K441DRAFT_545091, partial [Cenococcum geophilum 1.58]|uniref:uncharacterized protein n=1 Tax=Cenococcum geophilum 1.58 TaxID=794803 RepID=UPI00358E74FA
AENRYKVVVKLLLIRGSINPNSKDKCSAIPLLLAVKCGRKVVVELLLTGVSLNLKGFYNWTPLLLAIEKGYKAVVKLLL